MNKEISKKTVTIGNIRVGDGCKTFIIAEIGINHQGDVKIAKKMIDTAITCEADAVKFQKRTINKILTKEALEKPYCGPHSFGATYGEHRKALELSREDFFELKKYCDDKKIVFLASPWDEESADFLEELNVPAYKIASADLTNIPLLEHIAKKGKPIILSTGMADISEVDHAVELLKNYTCDIILMQCTSTYPCATSDINLNVIPMLRKRYDLLVGYSGHDDGIIAPVLAAVLGACIVEKHFTLNRTWKGGDHAASLEPYGLSKMIRDIHNIKDSLGSGEKKILDAEIPIRHKLAKSIVTTCFIGKGTVIERNMLTTKSPGTGIPPKDIGKIVGKKALNNIDEDVVINYKDVDLNQ